MIHRTHLVRGKLDRAESVCGKEWPKDGPLKLTADPKYVDCSACLLESVKR